MSNFNNIHKIKIINNQKLSEWFYSTYPNCSKNWLYKMLRQKDIKVNNVKVKTDCSLYEGDVVELYCDENILQGNNTKIKIVYEDDYILCAFKGRNLEVEGDRSLTSLLINQKGINLFPVHRIDRNTIGLVLFAKNKSVLNILIKATKNGEIKKYYLAWVYGDVEPKEKQCKAYIKVDKEQALSTISLTPKADFEPIVTNYKVVKTDGEKTLLYCSIHNGKTHQIRAHLAFLGYPLLGDKKYSTKQINEQFKYNYQQLFACQIEFHLTNDKLKYLNKIKISATDKDFK